MTDALTKNRQIESALRTALHESDEWATSHDLLRSLMDAGLYVVTSDEWAEYAALRAAAKEDESK